MQLEIHQQKAIELLLRREYQRFRSIDAEYDPKFFYYWLHDQGIISKEHLDLQLEELRKEEG